MVETIQEKQSKEYVQKESKGTKEEHIIPLPSPMSDEEEEDDIHLGKLKDKLSKKE